MNRLAIATFAMLLTLGLSCGSGSAAQGSAAQGSAKAGAALPAADVGHVIAMINRVA